MDFVATSLIRNLTCSLQLHFCNVSSRVVVRSYSPIVLQGMRLHYYVSSTIPTKSRRQQCSKTSSREQQVSSTRHVRDSPTLPGHTVLLSVWWLHIFHKVTARSSLFFLYRVGYSVTGVSKQDTWFNCNILQYFWNQSRAMPRLPQCCTEQCKAQNGPSWVSLVVARTWHIGYLQWKLKKHGDF